MDKVSILQMARGAIEERVDVEVSRVIENITDPNTNPTSKRKITITLEFSPDSTRQVIGLKAIAKSTLAATEAVATAMCITADENGEMMVAEMVPQIPGQLNMGNEVQEAPKILRLVATG